MNPQWLVLPNVNFAASDDASQNYHEVRVPLPVSRIGPTKGKSVIIEILKVAMDHPSPPNIPQAGSIGYQSRMQLSTSSLPAIRDDSPHLIWFSGRRRREYVQDPTGASAFSSTWVEPTLYDLTDGAGHGMLVATDFLYLGVNVVNWVATTLASFDCRIMYRFKEVSLVEYIGIVQSQSSG